MLNPHWQFKYWLRSILIPLRDFVFKKSVVRLRTKEEVQSTGQSRRKETGLRQAVALASVLALMISVALSSKMERDKVIGYISALRKAVGSVV